MLAVLVGSIWAGYDIEISTWGHYDYDDIPIDKPVSTVHITEDVDCPAKLDIPHNFGLCKGIPLEL